MKTAIKIVTFMIGLVALMPYVVYSQYYYGGGERIQLRIDSTRILIKFNSTTSDEEATALVADIDHLGQLSNNNEAIDGFKVVSVTLSEGYPTLVDSLRGLKLFEMVEPYYRNHSDSAFLVGQHFCVSFSDTYTERQIDSLASTFTSI